MTLDGRVRNQETQRMPAQLTYAGDPNGVLEAAEASFCWDTVGKVMYVNTDGATTWTTGFAPPTSPHILATTAALGPQHTVSGLTAGQVLRATGATTAAFEAIQDSDIPASIARDSELHSAVTLAISLDSNLLSLSTQELGLDTQAANIVFAGPTTGGAAVPSFRSLVDADIPSSIARDSELHAAVTLAASLDSNLLSLSTQELGLDTQAANLVFAGPVSGGAAVPAFRALVDTDIPAHVLATTSGLGSQHSVSGLTARQVLIATGATTALFRAIEDADIPASIARDSELHDAVTLSAGIDTNLLSLTGQEIGLDTQAANIIFAGPVSGGAAAPAFRSLVDADIPSSIARDSELHAAVTLAASLDSNLLSLSTQELGLDTQAANLVFAGPTTGAAAAPTFRSAVVADLPVGSAQYQFLMTGATPFAPVYTAVSTLAGAGMTATAGVLNVIAADTSMTINADSLQVQLAATSGLQISTGLMIADTIAGAGLTIASKVLAVGAGTLISVAADTVSLSNGTAQYQIPVTGATPFTPAYTALSTFAGAGLVFSSGVYAVGAGDGIDVAADSVAVDVTDFVGDGLVEVATNNIALGTPGSSTAASVNAVTASSHTHAIDSTIARSAISIGVSGLGLSGGGNLSANRTITLSSSAAGAADAHIVATDASGFTAVTKLTTPGVAAPASSSLNLQTITAGYAVRVDIRTTTIQRYVEFKEYATDEIQMNFIGSGRIASSDSLYLIPAADLIITTSGAGNDVVINTDQFVLLTSTGQVGIGTDTPIGQTQIVQGSATGAIPTLVLNQADLSEEIIRFNTTVGAGNPIDTAALGTYYGKVRVSVLGTFKYIALYNS